MGQSYNIIILYSTDIPDDQKTEMQIEALKVELCCISFLSIIFEFYRFL